MRAISASAPAATFAAAAAADLAETGAELDLAGFFGTGLLAIHTLPIKRHPPGSATQNGKVKIARGEMPFLQVVFCFCKQPTAAAIRDCQIQNQYSPKTAGRPRNCQIDSTPGLAAEAEHRQNGSTAQTDQGARSRHIDVSFYFPIVYHA